ncbi:MAG: ABC transporter substrate-binding protein [Gammaproteobacteria bacterium]|nr:ABC transporter substrate-binding protein [Gammaproteobacteria bacterium]
MSLPRVLLLEMSFYRLCRQLWAGMFLLCLSSGMAQASTPALEQVTLQLKWRHQFQFAGYYAAQEKGFFREEGLEVRLNPGGSDIAPLVEVLEGRAQYAVEAGELVYYRLQGKPVVALASIFQHSPAVLMALGDSGLRTPHDLAHKRIGIMVGGQPIVEVAAMFVNEGVSLDALVLRPNGVGMEELLNGKLDADFGYMTSEPFFNQQAGRDVHYIQPINYGVDFYGDTLFTSERHTQEHPDQVAALYRAVVRGWQYALDNPEETISTLLKRHPELEREALRYEAEHIRELIKPDIVQIGHMNAERWRRMADTFLKLGMVKDTSRLDGFLYDPEQKPDYRWLWWVLGVAGAVILLGFAGSGLVAWNNGRLREKNVLLQQVMQERQETGRLLLESKRSLQSLIGNLPGMAYRCHYNREWSMVFVSEGCEALTGYPASRLLGAHGISFNSLIHPEDQERIWEEVTAALNSDQSFQLTYRIRCRDGCWRWMWEQGHCVERDGQGEPLFLEGLIMDITSQVDTRQKLQEAKEKADAATRAKSMFLANISHEIRTPLMAVTGLTQLLQQSGLAGRQREYVEQLRSSSSLLLGIIEDVMDFSCIEVGEVVLRPAPFHLQGILQSVGHIVRDAAQAKCLAFHIDVDNGIPPVLVGDPLRLSQVLNNLLVNAVKFTNSGSVSLHASLQARSENGARLRFSVRDTGVGIPAGQRDSLFEPFVRIIPEGEVAIKGAGLGLSISRRLVELMGGDIKVESIPGVGSEFSFCADFGVNDEAGSMPVASISDTLLGARILLVDDEPLNRMIGTELLKILGCSPECVENAPQVLAALEREPFQVVLMDIEMPGMKGDELTRLLRADPRWRQLPVIALTAHVTTGARDAFLACGMDDYLGKPFNLEQLRTVLLKWLDRPPTA